jgi:hypothetical protein
MDDVDDNDRTYRDVIDRLVRACHDGQGQIGASRARAGLWNANADAQPDAMPDQRAMNRLLAGLDQAEREVLAQMLSEAFEGGVHETLVTLYDAEVPPFDAGYEGTPFHDFAGRLDHWSWPEEPGFEEPRTEIRPRGDPPSEPTPG